MKFNWVILLATVLFLTISSNAQKTYFIKYKSSVPIDVVELNVSRQILSNRLGDAPLALPSYNINYLAKGMGRGDEVLGRIVKIQFAQDVDAANFNSIMSNDPDIEYIQEANIYKVDAITPNDSLLSDQWALEKIKAFDAWEITQGEDSIIVAVIDMGMDYNHLDLKNRLFINPGESGFDNLNRDKKTNGIDDDNNGFIDDYKGWDFTDMVGFPNDSTSGDYLGWDNDPYDDIYNSTLAAGHGTQVAGVIAAEQNNFIGISGAAPNVRIINIRAFSPDGNGQEDDAAAALLYAIKMGAKIINMSWGDYSFSYVLRDVIEYAYSQNIVLIASAGNRNSSEPHYPSGYTEVISVSGTTSEDYIAGFNWGSTIDLVAPAINILTTDLNSKYKSLNGTSFAAPYVSAAAALILSKQNFSNEEVKQILKSTTDDIGEKGWDLKSGAGRLNIARALRVLAPSTIKFNFPLMDYATFTDSLTINASVLSAYFVSYSLEIGEGSIPEQWTTLIENNLNQFQDENIYTLNLHSYPEGSYTVRLVVNTNDGRTTEERVTFHIMRTPPKVTEVGVGSLYYGDRSTIAGEYYTNQPSIMKMYYRKFGENQFNFVSLDGFSTNNQFVKQLHYGFIPKDLIAPATNYEIYFEAENLAGLKTIVMDSTNGINYYNISTDEVPKLTSYQEMPFEMPNSNVWDKPVSFLSNNFNEILLQKYYTSQIAYFGLYKLENNEFIKVDSLEGKFPRAFGDFNNNGLKDYISYKNQGTVIDEQISQNTFNLTEKYNNSIPGNIVYVDDLDKDGSTEIIYQLDNISYIIRKIKSDLTVDTSKIILYKTYEDTLDFDRLNTYNNYVFNNLEVIDSDNDGINEIWFVDADADLISYKVNSLSNITKGDSLRIVGLSTTSLKDYAFSVGDYNGDGIKDFAMLFNTNSIAPTFYLMILTFINHNPEILFEKVFLDQSEEYSGGISFNNIYQSLKFIDIDNDNSSELILNLFPYCYIFKNTFNSNDLIFFREGSNTARVFSGDLNNNSVPEIGLLINEKLKFFEFANSNRTSIPSLVKGYSIDSTNIIVNWTSDAPIFYIYKGTSENNLDSLGFITDHSLIDNSVIKGQSYYYAVKAFDPSKPEPLSGLSSIIKVYAHTPAKPITALSNSSKSVIVTFSEKMNNTIENLQAFNIIGIGYPNSVTANDQYSYLISYNLDFPVGSQSIIIKDLKDLYGSPIGTDTLTFNVNPVIQTDNFYISSFEIVNSYKIKLSFNYPVDQSSAMNIDNYSFEPENKVSRVSIDQTDSKIIYLDLSGNKPIGSIGKEYVLRLTNLVSNQATGNLLINSGAGSFVVLSAYAKDLSDVYVYPNPSKEGSEKVTFANLPQKAKITIWSVDGKLINEIKETDGNGGVDYDLKDFSGNNISSGIYIFRIVMLDGLNNEGEEKLGKFAVVR